MTGRNTNHYTTTDLGGLKNLCSISSTPYVLAACTFLQRAVAMLCPNATVLRFKRKGAHCYNSRGMATNSKSCRQGHCIACPLTSIDQHPPYCPWYSERAVFTHLTSMFKISQVGSWCSGITSAPHAEGPGFKSQWVQFFGQARCTKSQRLPQTICPKIR